MEQVHPKHRFSVLPSPPLADKCFPCLLAVSARRPFLPPPAAEQASREFEFAIQAYATSSGADGGGGGAAAAVAAAAQRSGIAVLLDLANFYLQVPRPPGLPRPAEERQANSSLPAACFASALRAHAPAQ